MEKTKNKIVSIVIPALNEEEGIGAVLSQIPTVALKSIGYDVEVIVVDNGSTDRTAEIAQSYGARVIAEEKRGYGNAYKAGFSHATGDIIATGDADSTYPLDQLPLLLKKIEHENIDFLNTDRLKELKKESMSTWHVFGNWVLTTITRVLYLSPFRDSQSGMWVFKRSIWPELEVVSPGMPFSQELKLEAYWKGFVCAEAPIEYRPRLGEVKLRGMHDALGNVIHLFEKRLSIKRRVMKKKVAFVIDAIAPYSKGGRETRLYEITKLLAKDAEVHIYTMNWWNGPKMIESEGIYYHAICKVRPLYKGGRRSISEALFFALAIFKLLFEKFDVVDVDEMPFFHLFSARIVTWLRGKKMYATWHEVWGKEYWFEYMKGFSGYLGYVVERLALRLPDVIISNSLHTTSRLREVGVTQQIHTVPLGADFDDILKAEPHGEKSDVLFVGRLIKHKNADLLVKAIALVREQYADVRAIIVGDGPERIAIEDLIHTLHLEDTVRIFDRVEKHSELYGLMKSSKMLALPSVREGFGLVVVEANAAGIPVITTLHKDNAAKELIEEGVNGFLVEPTVEDIAGSIMRILKEGKKMKTQTNALLYDWKNVVKKFEQALTS